MKPNARIALFSNMKLHHKLLLSYLFVVLVPVVLIGYFLISRTTETMLQHTIDVNRTAIQQIKTNISSRLYSYIKLSYNVISNDILMRYLEVEYIDQDADKDIANALQYYEHGQIIGTYRAGTYNLEDESITTQIYTTNDTVIHDAFILYADEGIRKQPWYQRILQANGYNVIEPIYPKVNPDGSTIPVFSVGKVIYSPAPLSDKFDNILRIEVPESYIHRFIEKESLDKDIFILDKDNHIMTASVSRKEFIGKKFTGVTGMDNALLLKKGEKRLKINGTDYLVFTELIPIKGIDDQWKIVCLISYDSILESIYEVEKYSLLIIGLSVVIAFIFVLLFSNTLTKRLKMLVRNMGKIRDGKFDVFISYEEKDEIGELSRSFKNMIDRINVLISEVYIAEMHVKDLEIKRQEAEMNALQSQINPHFLFNTMESIRMNLLKKRDLETADIVEGFARLLRKSIDWGRDHVTLQHELELVDIYLRIQKFRYRDKLEYAINIEEALLSASIPKFTLQPIVENAIYHGIEMKEGKGRLVIDASLQENALVICVQDDGVGMDMDSLEQIRRKLAGEGGQIGRSIGMSNVHQRLQLYYGKQYGIEVESRINEGTTVIIRLPAAMDKGSDNHV